MKGIKDMSIYGRIKRKLYYIFAPMKYAQLAGVNFRGGYTSTDMYRGERNLGLSLLAIMFI